VNIQRHCSHLVLLVVDEHGENRWANDIDGSALAAQPGKSQGRPPKSPGSKPIVQNGLPSLRSPKKAPRPSQPNLSPPPDTTRTLTEQFHAPRRSRVRALTDRASAAAPRTRSEASSTASGEQDCVSASTRSGTGDRGG
jgi:hypothetical protein